MKQNHNLIIVGLCKIQSKRLSGISISASVFQPMCLSRWCDPPDESSKNRRVMTEVQWWKGHIPYHHAFVEFLTRFAFTPSCATSSS